MKRRVRHIFEDCIDEENSILDRLDAFIQTIPESEDAKMLRELQRYINREMIKANKRSRF